MSEHTPGPWFIPDDCPIRTPVNTNEKHVALVAFGFGVKETEHYANARLIASAPDLLAACKTAYDAIASLPIDAMGSGHDGELVWPIRDEVLDHIAKAITKAKGEVEGER